VAKPYLPLSALRAFEASARHLSFTKAGMELRVGQAAISHQVKALEARLGVELFRRLPRGLALTDEGQALIPAIAESFSRLHSGDRGVVQPSSRDVGAVRERSLPGRRQRRRGRHLRDRLALAAT